MPTKNSYTGENIKILKGLEGIRQRFDMYVGSIDTAANHLVKEVLDNSVDEFLNGHSTGIWIEYFEDENRIVIKDDGRGLPIDFHPTEKIPTMEVLFSQLHAGGKFDKDSFKVSSGKNGIGIKAVNALSSFLRVTSTRNGYDYFMEFSKGKKTKNLSKKKSTNKFKSGTTIEFIPDEEILKEYAKFNIEDIIHNLNVRTYSNAKLRIVFKSGKTKKEFYNENGIKDYIEELNSKKISDPIYFNETDSEGNVYEIVYNYGNTDDETFRSFVNGIATSKGTHETGFKMGFSAEILNYIKNPQNNILNKRTEKLDIKGEDIRAGLFCVINVKHLAPSFKGQTKDELSNPEVNGVMNSLTRESVKNWIGKNPNEVKKICNRIIQFAKGRTEASKIKDKIININNSSSGLSFSGKFSDCTSNNPEECELFIAEGKSASGNIRNCRIAQFQAIMPLRGKPLNVFGSKDSTILNNEEFKELIKIIFGTTDIKNVDYNKVRYHKILFASDADYDGLHIQSLLTLFFWEKFKPLFDLGYIYICLPPKYRTTINGKFIYFKNDFELNKFLFDHAKKSIELMTKEISLKKFIENMYEFEKQYEIVKRKYSVSDGVMDIFLHEDQYTFEKAIKDLGLKFKNDEEIQGMYDGIWHDFNLYELNDDAYNLLKIIPLEKRFDYKDDKGNIIKNSNIINCIKYINKKMNIKLDYFKGLGEASAEELFETTINPEKRFVYQLKPKNEEDINKIMQDLFGSNTDARKLFIKDILNLAN